MKSNFTLILILLTIVSLSCTKKTCNTSIPGNAVPFEYDEKQQRAILLKGLLNDSIPQNVFLDTGYPGELCVSDNFRGQFGSDTCSLRLGRNLYYCKYIEYLDHNNKFFEYFGANTIMIGQFFFTNRIIEISYKSKYIRELTDTTGLDSFKCIPIDSMAHFLKIPVEIYMQGKKIEADVRLDTGSNGLLDLRKSAEAYSISKDSAQYVVDFSFSGSHQKYFLHCDSIKVGYAITPTYPVGFSSKMNLLGNVFLENFDVVIDLKHCNLYLKPNEQK